MNDALAGRSRKRRIDWSQLEAGDVIGVLLPSLATLVSLAMGWITYPLYLLLLAAEMQVVAALSGLLYPRRGWRRVPDALKMLGISAFMLLILMAIYVSGMSPGMSFIDKVGQSFALEPRTLASAFGLLALRIAILWVQARRSSDPRYTWGSSATREAAVSFLSMFFGAFASVAALELTPWLAGLSGERARDLAFGTGFILVQTAISLIAATLTEDELKRLVGDPYPD